MAPTSTPITTRLTIVTEGRTISDGNGDDTHEEIVTPNTGAINPVSAPMIFGGALLLIIILFVFFKNRHKTGFHLSKKRTLGISIITILALFGLLNAATKLNQPEEAKAAKVQYIEADYLTIDAASAGELTLNLDDFESGKVAYIKDTITVNEDIVGAHIIEFTATVPEDNPFGEALVYTTSDPTAQDTTWQALPADKTIMVEADASAKDQTYDIYYGVNPTEIPAGTYTVDINYDANIAFDGTMQSMNQTICRRLPLETRFTLKDIRDDKEYRIVHLADDSCWMIDDLALELSTSKTLTSADTDLNTKDSWTPNMSTTDDGDDNPCNNMFFESEHDYNICKAEYNASIYNSESDTYYYNWSAATATDLDYEVMLDRLLEEELYVAEDSICPKGWQIPLDAHYNSAFNAYEGGSVWDILRLRNSNNTEGIYPIIPIIAYNPASGDSLQLNDYYLWAENDYWQISRDDLDYEDNVRCVLNYSGEATLTIGNNTQTATLSRAGAEFTIPDNIPARDGYTFMGYVAVNMEQDETYSKIVYLPGRTYTFYAPHTVLYPIWREGYLEMQHVYDWEHSLPVGLQVQAVDTRDNKLYWVAKLKDGNIWMTQNLDYDIMSTGNIVSDKYGSTLYWSPGFATSANLYDNVNVASNYSLSYDPGDFYLMNGTGGTTTKTPISCTTENNGGKNCHYHYGNYYQWYAATAGSGSNASSEDDAISSICPAGWVLPSAYEEYDVFTKLFNAYKTINKGSDATILAEPFYFTRTGNVDYAYNSNQLKNFGTAGYYWTATKGWDTAHYLSFSDTGIATPANQGRYEGYGNTVRCISLQTR